MTNNNLIQQHPSRFLIKILVGCKKERNKECPPPTLIEPAFYWGRREEYFPPYPGIPHDNTIYPSNQKFGNQKAFIRLSAHKNIG